MSKIARYNPIKTWIVKNLANMYGVSYRYVYMVIAGDREDEAIFTSYMDMQEASKKILLDKVNELVPFETKKATA